MTYDTREGWLNAAVTELRTWFGQIDVDLPEQIRVSCGWSKRAGKAIGWCWKREASEDKTSEILISPELAKPDKVLATLVHELIHASDNGESEHAGAFKQRALAIGLTGKMTATSAGPALQNRIDTLATSLGTYPHASLNPLLTTKPKQSTRMIKVVCPDDGYTVRTTRKWIDVGLPTCPCGTEMEVE